MQRQERFGIRRNNIAEAGREVGGEESTDAFDRVLGEMVRTKPGGEDGKGGTRNEQRKMRATFCSNLAVGIALAGVALPYLALVFKFGELTEPQAREMFFGSFTRVFFSVGAAITAFMLSGLLRQLGLNALVEIED